MEFNNVSKIGLRTQVRQRVPEIYHFSHRKPHKLKILNVSTLLNSIRTFSTKILVPASNSLSKLVSKLTNGEK
jgi:hypothetical protein